MAATGAVSTPSAAVGSVGETAPLLVPPLTPPRDVFVQELEQTGLVGGHVEFDGVDVVAASLGPSDYASIWHRLECPAS